MERNDSLRVFKQSSAFVFTDGKLQQVKLLRTDFTYDHSVGSCMYYKALTSCQLPDGKTIKVDSYDRVFGSPSEYEDEHPMATNALTCSTTGASNVLCDITRGHRKRVTPDYWVFDTICNSPAHYTLSMEKFYYDYHDMRFHTDEFPANCEIYDTKELALSYNTYKVAYGDGTEKEREGINKLVTLDDDQRELVKQFEEICHKMEESEILLVTDYTDTVCAFNTRKLSDYLFDSDTVPYTDSHNPEDYEQIDRYGKGFQVKSNIVMVSDDCFLHALRKQMPEQN